MKETLKDIKKLTSGLYRSQDAEKVAEELYEADRLALRLEMVTPDARLIAAIKANVASELSAKHHSNRWIIRVVAAAACVVFAYTLTTRLYLQSGPLPVQAVSQPVVAVVTPAVVDKTADAAVAMVWDDEADQVSTLSTRLSNIETALYQADNNSYEAEFCITDIETQVNDLQGLFWKG